MQSVIKIAPSLLSCDFSRLKEAVLELEKSSAEYVHLDVMDGHFVPNITFGASVIAAIRPFSKKIFDTHLMIENPSLFLEDFVKAGSDIISIHSEIEEDVVFLLKKIRRLGKKAGLVFNPETSLEGEENYFPFLDQILLMSVHPGFGGQKFIPSVLERGRFVSEKIKTYCKASNKTIDLEIDGGINDENIVAVKESGFDVAVAGSFLYNQPNLEKGVLKLRN